MRITVAITTPPAAAGTIVLACTERYDVEGLALIVLAAAIFVGRLVHRHDSRITPIAEIVRQQGEAIQESVMLELRQVGLLESVINAPSGGQRIRSRWQGPN